MTHDLWAAMFSGDCSARRCCGLLLAFALLAATLALPVSTAFAQKPPAKKEPGKDKKEDEGPPEPAEVWLKTKDDVKLFCKFYAGNKGRKTIPIIMLHAWGDHSGSEFDALSKALQGLGYAAGAPVGYAIAVPDLRGHGRSTRRVSAAGDTEELDVKKFTKVDVATMLLDVDAVKKMLVEKNDEEELNLNALCVVGAGEGGLIALNWSVFDWNFASTATLKQGQDVKAIGLLSPAYSFKGITVKDALIHPVVGKQLSIFLAVGKKDAKSITDAKRIHQTLAGFHPKPGPASEERRAEEDFYYFEKDTNLAGTDLLEKTLKTPRDFADFLTRRIAAHLDDDNFEWVDRHTKSVDGN